MIWQSNLTGTNVTVNASALTGNLSIKINDAASSAVSNDVITGGSGNDTIYGGDGIDTIDLSAGGVDTVGFDAITRSTTVGAQSAVITAVADRDTIAGFTTGSGTGGDLIKLGLGNADLLSAVTGAGTSVTLTASKIHEFAFDSSNNSSDLSAATTGAELGKGFISGGTATAFTGDGTGYIIAYDNGNAYLYYFNEEVANDGSVALATEVFLIGTFTNIAVGGFAAANITA